MVFEVNVFGVIMVTNAMLPLLLRSAAARIVNLSSSVGSLARVGDSNSAYFQTRPSAAYGPSKAALNALTVQYAKELRKDKILVNSCRWGRCRHRHDPILGILHGSVRRSGCQSDCPPCHTRFGRPNRRILRRKGPGAVVNAP